IAREQADYESVKEWLGSNAIPLRTVEAGNGFEDMQPLKKLIGNSRIVALGEATHGTREFFQLKHRMLEFLVNEMGFTVFGMEVPMPDGFDVNEYVLNGIGNPDEALEGLHHWCYNTEEVLEMIRWMRKYNEDVNHPAKVKFYGFDIQFIVRPVKRAVEYLGKVDPEQARQFSAGLEDLADPFLANRWNNGWAMPVERREEMTAIVNTLANRFDKHKVEYIQRSTLAEWEVARQHVNIIEQNLLMLKGTIGNVRDSTMAENIRWILEQEGSDTKMVVWAHNYHVAESTADLMGWHLRKIFGNELVTIGLAFNQGSFKAVQLHPIIGGLLHTYTVDPAPEGSFDATFAAAGLTVAAINFHDIPQEGPVNRWFTAPHAKFDIGDTVLDEADTSFHSASQLQFLAAQYNAILFIEKTTASRPNKTLVMKVRKILNSPENLDFEKGYPGGLPLEWEIPIRIASSYYQAVVSADKPWSGKQCVMVKRKPNKEYNEPFGLISQAIDATAYREKKITLRASVRVESNENRDKAYLWVRVYKPGYFNYYNLSNHTITSNNWNEYEITGDVAADAMAIEYGLAFVGDGAAYLDAITLESIDK
ncbi:MAG: erythromycin esterase family protein, partial [ANME-2 cluster archaeon]